MNRKNLLVPICVLCASVGALVGSFANAGADSKSAGTPEMKLPKGWTPEDMQACMAAGTPGEQHAFLAKSIGTWKGTSTHVMAPDADPMVSDCTSVVSSSMDGRFTQVDFSTEMPGMGMMKGMGLHGYDNTAKKFVTVWVSNMCTSMMTGTGAMASDGSSMTWTYSGNCPISKKPMTMREVQSFNSANSMTLEMYCPDPKTGKEYKAMTVELTRG
ncbi:MAG: DUF1579 family protein [Phycisphaerales bacterium]